jgi:phosphate transport system substrate-binding protein
MAALALAVAGCGGNSGTTAGGGASSGATVNGAGATFPYPLYTKWFQAYQQANTGIAFNYQAVGSGAGIAQYQAGTVDFAGTDVALTDAEVAELPRPTLHIPTVAGAVVLAYNIPGVGADLKLSGDVIADMYLGKIKAWNDPRITAQNPGVALPASAVSVAHRSDGSGTTNIFTSYLSAVSPEWKDKVGTGKSVNWPAGLGGSGNPGVAGLIKNSQGAIGYVELAYAEQTGLHYAMVRNQAGQFVKASTESTTAAAESFVAAMEKDVRTAIVNAPGKEAYPISGFTYLLVPRSPGDSAKGKALKDFLIWAMGPGQEMAAELLYAPLPPPVVASNKKAIEQISVGG